MDPILCGFKQDDKLSIIYLVWDLIGIWLVKNIVRKTLNLNNWSQNSSFKRQLPAWPTTWLQIQNHSSGFQLLTFTYNTPILIYREAANS